MITDALPIDDHSEKDYISDIELPSQKTYDEMEELTYAAYTNSSLRSAPPGGTPIGGVPLQAPCAFSFIVPVIIYLIIKKRKFNRSKQL